MLTDVEFLSRIQFAFVVAFHIIFPSFTIGLATFLVIMEGVYLRTKNIIYKQIYLFLLKLLAITFGLGVVTGVVMSYQFGTNWSVFSDKVSNVIGPLFGYEVLTAFFLEAGFLGIMFFGWNKVSKNVHFFATCMVGFGTVLSAFWILSANSWMHTPAGFEVSDSGIFLPKSFKDIIFNPSFPYRFFHMVVAAYITTSFCIIGIASYFLLRKSFVKHAKIMLTASIFFASIVVPLQLFLGDSHGLHTRKYQPAKIAAIEAMWHTERGAPLTLFGIPDEENLITKYAIKIPKLGSLILTHSFDGEIKGLSDWKKNDRPPVMPVFFGFRIMVGIWILMAITVFTGVYLFFKKKLFVTSWFHKWCIPMSISGFVAILAGWVVTEVGRQPYVVYGFLRTSDAVSPIHNHDVIFSLILFFIVYMFITSFGLYYMFKVIKKGILDDKAYDINLHTNSFKYIFRKP